ncbi:hypothetical protein EDD99_2243 [Streptomyces sp. 846.5]|nr:hypothetical protein EDD99_2243 [Streptomyces sp. 846.5]
MLPLNAYGPRATHRLSHTPTEAIPLILRRVGASPRERGSMQGGNCPDIFELSDGRFAVIGTEMTAELDAHLPLDASRADYEKIVVISRDTLLRAKADIPDL